VSRHSTAFKIQIAKACLSGGGAKGLGRRYRVPHSKVRLWAKLYQVHGTQGLAKKFSHYSAKFKRSVLRRMWAKSLSYTDTAAIYNIRNPSCLANWERLYREGGMEALRPRRRGRRKAMSDHKDRPPPAERSDADRSREELIAELNELRMENAYLKKLDALVQARQAPKGRK